MDFNQKNNEALGKKVGFVTTLLISSLILYLVFTLLDKVPRGWNYLHFLSIVLIVIFISKGIAKALE